MDRIRPARPKDAAPIAQVCIESWRAAYPGVVPDRVLVGMSAARETAKWRTAIGGATRGSEVVLVAESTGAGVVGIVGAGPARPFDPRYAGEVYSLYVLPDHQGRGLGSTLLCVAFESLARIRLGSAIIWVLADNPARFFYEAMGGDRVAERREQLWGAVLPQVAFGWNDTAAAVETWGRNQVADD